MRGSFHYGQRGVKPKSVPSGKKLGSALTSVSRADNNALMTRAHVDHPLAAYLKSTKTPLSEVATALGVQPPAVSKWSRRGVPAERVLEVERITGIPRSALRPDIYPPSKATSPAPQPTEPAA